jgi:hypothetical protein
MKCISCEKNKVNENSSFFCEGCSNNSINKFNKKCEEIKKIEKKLKSINYKIIFDNLKLFRLVLDIIEEKCKNM